MEIFFGDELLKLDDKWGKKYPIVLQSWQNKWENLSYYFKYPIAIRKIMYTTNIIESVHNWSLTISQLAIFFEGRLDNYLEL
jgi:putative transposase